MLWEWRGIANMAFIQLGGSSRVGEIILARERSGFAGEKDDEDDDDHDGDEKVQDDDEQVVDKTVQEDDDEEQTESDDDGDDFVHPKLTTHDDEIIHEEDTDEDDSSISSSDEEDSDDEVEGTKVEGAKSGEEATYEEDQGNEAVKDTNTDLDERDDLSSSVSSGFASNMLNPNQDTGVDVIFGQHVEATALIDIPVTAIAEPSFFAPTNRPPTLNPLFIQLQQPPILTPATTLSSSLQNLPDFGSSRCCSPTEVYTKNQQFLDSIDEGMKKVIKEQVKKEVSKITPKKGSLVRSLKEANTSHAVAANLSELELKKILIDKMEANNSINRSDIQRQLYKALVDAYEADKILLDTYGDTVTIKRPRDGADDDQEPSAGTDRGSKRRRSGKEPASTSAPRETTTTTAGKTTTTGSKTHKQSASQSAPVEETMQTTDVFEAPAHQEFETGVHDEQAEEESAPAVRKSVQPWLSNLARRQDPRESFDELTDTTFDFSAFVMNRLNVKTLTPELLAGPTFELMKGTCKSLTELEYFCEEVYKATTEKLDWINPEGRQYPHDQRQPLPLVPNSQGRHVIPFHQFINNDLEYLRGGESSRKYSTSVMKTKWYGNQLRDDYSKEELMLISKWIISNGENDKHLTGSQYVDDDILIQVQRRPSIGSLGNHIKRNSTSQSLTLHIQFEKKRRLHTITPDPRGFIYENKDKKNRLMRIDELHKFSDGTLDDVRTALNDRLKGIRMEYLPQTFWSQHDKVNARAMIQAIGQKLTDKDESSGAWRDLLWKTISGVLSDIEDSHGPSDAMHKPLPATQSRKDFVSKLKLTRYTHSYDFSTPSYVDIEKVALSSTLQSLKLKVHY
ncbi:hypothetical protein Tco_1273437 [Tanacetum coccineum]